MAAPTSTFESNSSFAKSGNPGAFTPKKVGLITLLLLGCIGLYVMGTMPLQDPSEGRHAVVAQNMLLSGNWITPMTTEDGEATPFLGKPPLQFWLISTSLYLFGHNELASRLPSLCATALAMVVLFRFASVFLTAEIGIAAILINVTSLIGFFFSGACMLDPLLAACVLISVCALPLSARLYELGEERNAHFWELAGFIALAGGLLCKGPIAVVLTVGSLIPWIALSRPWPALRRIHWVRGACVTTALAAPWYLLADFQQPGFLNYFIIHENILRFLVKKYGDLYGSGHRHFRGMIWFMTLFACVPWVIIGIGLLVKKIVSTLRAQKDQTVKESPSTHLTTGLQVALGLAFFPALFFTASRQVSIYYTLPSIPALSLLLAYWIVTSYEQSRYVISTICTVFRVSTVVGLPIVALYSWRSRPDLLFTALMLVPIGFVALYEVWVSRQKIPPTSTFTIARTAFYLGAFYLSGALFQLTDYVGGASCRDLLYYLTTTEKVRKISFFEKVPHSALFYSAALGDTLTDRKITFDELPDLTTANELDHPLVIRQKALDKLARKNLLPHLTGRRSIVVEGGWVVYFSTPS
jgi:4-amino-4-deoxy-L-arabinose transferase-like glycosyltransferase